MTSEISFPQMTHDDSLSAVKIKQTHYASYHAPRQGNEENK